MPIYEYQCTACGHQLEALQKVSDPALTHCDACNSENLQKLVSAAGFQLKGTGWYATDFKNTGKPTTTTKSTDAATTEKTDAKPSGGSDTVTKS